MDYKRIRVIITQCQLRVYGKYDDPNGALRSELRNQTIKRLVLRIGISEDRGYVSKIMTSAISIRIRPFQIDSCLKDNY